MKVIFLLVCRVLVLCAVLSSASFGQSVLPLDSPVDSRDIGVPYLLDDFDGRVLDSASRVRNMGFNEFAGVTGVGYGGSASADTIATGAISSTEHGGDAHTSPYAYKIDYAFHPDSTGEFVFYFNKLAPNGSAQKIRDFSFLEKLSIWLKGSAQGNPGAIVLEFHDETWQSSGFTSGKAHISLQGIQFDAWQQWLIPLENDSLTITGSFDFSRLEEVVISFDYNTVQDKSGALLIDDLQFVDTDQQFIATPDFQQDDFLELLGRRTFQYFLDAVNQTTGLVQDRVHFSDQATVAGVGFGLTAICIGTERGWISRSEAEAYVTKVLDHLLSTPQGTATTGTSGYKGFFYHFLDAETGLRKDANVELSVVDTAILLAGALTCREYFSANATIVGLVDDLYHRIEWPWFLDTTNPGADDDNRFYLGWRPESGFTGHWDYSTDEVMLINLLAIGSPSHPVSNQVFYAWQRETGTYGSHTFIQSWNGSMFQYFFANCWYDLHGKRDAQGMDWWQNSVKAGLANRDFCIAGTDGLGRQNVPTYHANSWGLSAMEAIPAGRDTLYSGENGARPNGLYDAQSALSQQINGAVPVYGGLSMIGFAAQPDGLPDSLITGLMQHYYRNTQLWTGWYGFRDGYTDSSDTKPGAISKFPIYKSAYFAIDQGPMLIMLENYRTGLVWNTFMANATVQQAIEQVFGNPSSNIINVPGDFATIQAAIDAAVSGDTILVAAGTYAENIVMKSDIELRGTSGGVLTPADSTDDAIIDGADITRTVTLSGVTNATIKGFTIINGRASDGFGLGGNIYCVNSTVSIVDNLIADGNRMRSTAGPGRGGGIYFVSSGGEITNNIFRDNWAWGHGGGMYLSNADPLILGNTFFGNTSDWGAGIYCTSASPTIKKNIFDDNFADFQDGGGLYCSASSPVVENNTFVNNRAGLFSNGEGGAIYLTNNSAPTIFNNIVAFNTADKSTGGIFCEQTSAAGLLEYNDVYQNSNGDYGGCVPGTGSISADPLFVDFVNRDYGLQAGSPCMDAGNPNPIYNDADGSRNDMGAFGGTLTPAQTTATFHFPIAGGAWYLASLPVVPDDNALASLFPNAISAFGWDFAANNYVQATALDPGRAYWLLFLQADTVEVTGQPLDNYSINFSQQGWDLIGGVLEPSEVVDDPDGSVISMFGWDALAQNYFAVDPMIVEPQQGYWILVFGVPSSISLGSGSSPVSGVAAKTGGDVQADLAAFYQLYGTQPPAPPASVSSDPYSEISVPTEFGLSQNYPNPFNPSTTINYQLPMSSRVTVTIYDVLGREIRTLVAGVRPAGTHRVLWDGRDAGGQQVESGVYFVRMRAGQAFVQTRKLLLVR